MLCIRLQITFPKRINEVETWGILACIPAM